MCVHIFSEPSTIFTGLEFIVYFRHPGGLCVLMVEPNINPIITFNTIPKFEFSFWYIRCLIIDNKINSNQQDH